MKTTITISIAEAMKEGNSVTNQNIKSKFVSQHVHANVNQMAEYIINKSYEDSNAPFNIDDVTNYYIYPEYIGEYINFEGGNEEQRQAVIDEINALLDDDSISVDLRGNLDADLVAMEELESEPSEIYEWWMVSGFLCEKLKEQGYCVVEDLNIWGRTTTGQAILLDYVITKICVEMEILEGQRNSWA